MIDYENMIKALRLSWLKPIFDVDSSGFWKTYLNYLLHNQEGLFLFQCNYDIKETNISEPFYRELLEWWSKWREIEDPDNVHKYILWNNKEIRIDGKTDIFFINIILMRILNTQLIFFMIGQILSLLMCCQICRINEINFHWNCGLKRPISRTLLIFFIAVS